MNLDEAKQILKENDFIVEKEQLNEAVPAIVGKVLLTLAPYIVDIVINKIAEKFDKKAEDLWNNIGNKDEFIKMIIDMASKKNPESSNKENA